MEEVKIAVILVHSLSHAQVARASVPKDRQYHHYQLPCCHYVVVWR